MRRQDFKNKKDQGEGSKILKTRKIREKVEGRRREKKSEERFQ